MDEFRQEAASGVLPVGDHQGGARIDVPLAARAVTAAVTGVEVGVTGGHVSAVTAVTVLVSDRQAFTSVFLCVVLAGAPGGAFGSEVGEGCGVVVGAGGEVAPEAEHVSPLPQAEVGVLGPNTEVPGGVDHAAGVVGEVVLGEFGEEAESAVEGDGGGLGSLGGVLGDVGGDVPVGDRGVAGEVGAADRADVDLPPEPERRGLRRPCRVGLSGPGEVLVLDAGALGGCADGVVEEFGGGPGWRVTGGAGGSVDATVWKWIWPRFWYSATLAYDKVAWWRRVRWVPT